MAYQCIHSFGFQHFTTFHRSARATRTGPGRLKDFCFQTLMFTSLCLLISWFWFIFIYFYFLLFFNQQHQMGLWRAWITRREGCARQKPWRSSWKLDKVKTICCFMKSLWYQCQCPFSFQASFSSVEQRANRVECGHSSLRVWKQSLFSLPGLLTDFYRRRVSVIRSLHWRDP